MRSKGAPQPLHGSSPLAGLETSLRHTTPRVPSLPPETAAHISDYQPPFPAYLPAPISVQKTTGILASINPTAFIS